LAGPSPNPSHGIDNTPEPLAKVRNLPFDRLRVNGLRLKLFSFSVRGEPFDSPFALRFSKGERFAQDKLVEPQKNTFARGSTDTVFINRRSWGTMEQRISCGNMDKEKSFVKKILRAFCWFIRSGN